MRNHLPLLFALLAGCAALEGKPQAVRTEKGIVWVAQALPTGRKSTSSVLVERGTPAKVPVGKPFEYEIRVTNLTDHELYDVVVDELLGEGVAINSSEPAATKEGAHWDLGTLAKGQVVSIRVNATPATAGTLASRCEVRYRALVGGAVMVVEPKLAIESVVPAQTLVDEPATVKFTVTNPGTGDTSGVVIDGQLPEGVQTLDGQSTVKFDVGNLPAGASREFVVQVKSATTGAYALKAVATSGDGLTAQTGDVKLDVRRAKLELTATVAADWMLDRPLACTYKVKNAGDGDARGVRVEVALPQGLGFVSATEGGALVAEGARWELGTIAAGQERTVELRVTGPAAGEFDLAAKASADFTEPAAAASKTRLKGIAALALEVVDNEDPVAVGGEVTYTITVKNQGTAADKNVRVECQIEDGMVLASAEGVTKQEGSGEPAKSFAFQSLDTLEPGQSATWTVKVKAEKAGDFRFRASVTSGQTERPVGEAEATKFIGTGFVSSE
jgi:uncharacterized repeat protein (TIGR01451 family)